MKKCLFLLALLLAIPSIVEAAPAAQNDGGEEDSSPEIAAPNNLQTISKTQLLAPYNDTPPGCKNLAGENAFVCTAFGLYASNVRRSTQDEKGNTGETREILTIKLPTKTIVIESNGGNTSMLDSCERLATKILGHPGNTGGLTIQFRYSRNIPGLAKRFEQPNQFQVVLNPKNGKVDWLQCDLTPGTYFHQ